MSVMSHNAQVNLCNLYQFAEAFNGIANCKIFCPFFMFHHSTINCIWLMFYLPAWDTRRRKEFSESGPNSFLSYDQHILQGGRKFSGDLAPAPPI